MKKLIIFDVDGVLLDNKFGGFKDILVFLGKEKEVEAIDEEYQRRKFRGPWGLENLAALYKDFLQDELKRLSKSYCQENLMEGAKAAVTSLKKKGFIVGALSSNPQFLMDSLSEILGLDFSEGTKLELKNGKATGKISEKVDRYAKAEILKKEIERRGLEKKDVIIVGDSITDLPMAKEAGAFFAFNAKEEIKPKADVVIEKRDLREILKHIDYGKTNCF